MVCVTGVYTIVQKVWACSLEARVRVEVSRGVYTGKSAGKFADLSDIFIPFVQLSFMVAAALSPKNHAQIPVENFSPENELIRNLV